MYSAKELEHYERVRKTFDSSSEPHKDATQPSPNPQVRGTDTQLPTRPKSKDRPASKGKGKGKAAARDWGDFEADDEPSDEEDEAPGNNRANPNGHKSVNGWAKGKGVSRNFGPGGFGDPSENDEAELYG